MKFIKYLYYKFYKAQVYIGNRDVAAFFALLMLLLIFWFYLLDIYVLIRLFFNFKTSVIKEVNFKFFAAIIIMLSASIMFYKKRYKQIISNSEFEKESNLPAIVFTVFPLVIFFVGVALQMLKNN